MSDDWMPLIKLPLTLEQFEQLPRNPAYKYEYLDRKAYLTPRPRHYHAWLDLRPIEAAGPVDLRPLPANRLPSLERLFATAFRAIQPFGSLSDAERLRAAREALARTRTGGDGPLVEQACFVAYEEGAPVGALLVTLLPPGDPADWDSYHWEEPPPPDCVAQRLGRPHLTWIFVSPFLAGHGLGTSLLAAAVRELMTLGYSELLSTFVLGNESSMLWHWRNGFRLLPYPGSYRAMQKRWQDLASKR
jgi:GNAT superfamily N-acetyltransferase